MKLYRGMIVFFILTVVCAGLTFGLQSSGAYRTYAISLFIGLISLFLSFTLSIVSLIRQKDYHRGHTIFILASSSLGVIFVIVVIAFILFFF